MEADTQYRDAGRCVRCGVPVAGIPHSCHHRQLKGQGGHDMMSNRATTCGTGTTGCHGWIHAHPILARIFGWLLQPWDEPAQVRMWHAHLEMWVLLRDDRPELDLAPDQEGDRPCLTAS